MIGIYKITNNITGDFYIGQSKNIKKRQSGEKSNSKNKNCRDYNNILSKSFREYGIENFTFSVIEECSPNELLEKEHYQIQTLKPTYNKTQGFDYDTSYQKLSIDTVSEIQNKLINDIEGKIRHCDLAKEYNVSIWTITDINVGRLWKNSNYTYPLHYAFNDPRREKEKKEFRCIDCNVIVSKGSLRCKKCNGKYNQIIDKKITRDVLKKKIRYQSFLSIGKEFDVTDNAIRKWCDYYHLPRVKKIINTITDEDWLNI